MRNLFDSQIFITETEKILQNELNTHFSTEVLSRIIPSALGDRFTNQYRITDGTLTNLLILSLISWYVPEDLGILLRLEIQEKIADRDTQFLDICLRNKGLCLCFLLETTAWSTREFFGNILTISNIENSLRSLRPIMKTKRKVNRSQRHRGYRDKGTLRKNSDRHDLWISTAEQMKLEESRLSSRQTLDFIEGWIT